MTTAVGYRAKHIGPDTASMTMQEVIDLRKLRAKLTERVESDEIAFRREMSLTVHCDSCNKAPEWLEGFDHVDADGNKARYPGRLLPLMMIELQRVDPALPAALLCDRCFRALWCEFADSGIPPHYDTGNGHRAVPHSQRSYDGGDFNSGEW